jgi:T5SS/PEP-CTERM-associated repeat protein
MRRGCLIAGFLLWIALGSRPSVAQYTANFQTNVISGVTSNWSFSYNVGFTNFADVLLIQGGGVLSNGTGSLGYYSNSINNSVLVTDPGSIWSNLDDVYVGVNGYGNSLVISNGGRVVSGPLGQGVDVVGQSASSSNNSVAVTGAGSIWNETVNYLMLGYFGGGNTLLIGHGGQVFASRTIVGDEPGSTNNSILVTDSGSVWSNAMGLSVGYRSAGNAMTITNGGKVYDATAIVGNGAQTPSSSNNTVRVTGTGSLWNNSGSLNIGFYGPSNLLVISGGGQVAGLSGFVGSQSGSNAALVTDPGSLWNNTGSLCVGYYGPDNSLVISNGAQVINSSGYVGYYNSAAFGGGSSNSVRVVDDGVWQNNVLYVGYQGSSNSVVVTGGSVYATNLVVGAASATCDNVLEVNESFQLLGASRVVVTNALHNAVLEVRHGTLILGGGVVQADTLVMTNSCASFVHAGGTLIVGNVVLDPNTFRIVSLVPQSNDLLITWMMGPGATNTLQATAGDGGGGYNTNGFSDIFIVTNNTTVGTVTNYLDIGAATNAPARFYRARLVP